MLTPILFAVIGIAGLVQENVSQPSSSKITVDNKEVQGGKIPPLPRGGIVDVTTDPNTGKSIVSIKQNSKATNRAFNRTAGLSDREDELAPDRVTRLISPATLDDPAIAQGKPTKISEPDGSTHYITTLAIGTLDVWHFDNIEAGKQTSLEATLTLNQIIPNAIRQQDLRFITRWFLKAEYKPQSREDFLSAKTDTNPEQEIFAATHTMRWRWLINPQPGFERDQSPLVLRVRYESEKQQLQFPIEVASRDVLWLEKKPTSAVSLWFGEVKDYLVPILLGLVTIGGSWTAIILGRYQIRKLKLEIEKAEAETTHARAQKGTSSAELLRVQVQKNFLEMKLKKLTTQLVKLRRNRLRRFGLRTSKR